MNWMLRHLTGPATALAFGIASIFCACAGPGMAASEDAYPIDQHASHCHDEDEKRPSEPCDHGPQHDHSGCNHCSNLLTNQGSPSVSFNPLLHALSPFGF